MIQHLRRKLNSKLKHPLQHATVWLAGLIPIVFLAGVFITANLENYFEVKAEASIEASILEAPIAPKEVSIVFAGDIMLSRGVNRAINKNNNINFPFAKLSDYINSADFGFANLETPITPGREIVNMEMVFRSEPGVEKAMKDSGFDILSLANNHSGNFGALGLRDTFDYLKNAGIEYVGGGVDDAEANAPLYFEKNGIRFAILAYTDPTFTPYEYEAKQLRPGVAFMRTQKMIEAVNSAKMQADFVIVSIHAGDEYKPAPNKRQVDFSRAAIDAGADLIIGHHPHVVQTMEKYNGKYIFNSLGNFVFDQMFNDDVRKGLVVKATFNKDGVKNLELLPTWMEFLGQPRLADVNKYHLVLDRLNYDIQGDSNITVYKK